MLFDRLLNKTSMPTAENALPGRETPIIVDAPHYVNQRSLNPPWPQGILTVQFGLGCFWGAERKFWQAEGVYITAVGYAAGITPNPTYEEVCSGQTGHNEVVLVAYDPDTVHFEQLLAIFWESHDPTQGMRQGNDRGTQYRSGIYTYNEAQQALALSSKHKYEQKIAKSGYANITTEVVPATTFYYAETYHQQYLAKNPNGYCGLGGTGISCDL